MSDPAAPPFAVRKRPQSLLFACTFNSVRSPMAEAIGRSLFPREVFFASVGVRPGELDPFAIAAMAEIGIDMTRHVPRTFDDLEDDNFDMIISLSPEAHHTALDYIRTMAINALYWPTIDPTAVHGSREQRLEAYRQVRDGLMEKITDMFRNG